MVLLAYTDKNADSLSDIPPSWVSPINPFFDKLVSGTYDVNQNLSDDGVSTVSYSITGTLPDGVTFDTITGIITYTTDSSAATTTGHTVTATDAVGNDTSAAFDITITEASVFVSQLTGDNVNSGDDWDNAKETIAGGLAVLLAGETMLVATGVYVNDGINDDVPSGTSWNNTTTIKANPGDTVQITGSAGASINCVSINSSEYIEVIGFILGPDNISEQSRHDVHDGVKISWGGDHIRIKDCEVRYTHNQGLLVSDSSDNEFLDNHVHHCGVTDDPTRTNQVHGIYLAGNDDTRGTHRNKIWGNDCHNNQAYDIQCWDSSSNTNVDDNDIQYNKMRDSNVRGGIVVKGSDNLIANNIIWDNAASDPALEIANGDGNKIYHNTVYNSKNDGIEVSSSATNTIVRNNIAFNSSGTDINDLNPGSTTKSNNITSDPSFVDAANDDFHLQTGSSAIGAGTNLLADVPDDFDRVLRDSNPEAGAYEFV
jgi:parallel beta-helix repeat protein